MKTKDELMKDDCSTFTRKLNLEGCISVTYYHKLKGKNVSICRDIRQIIFRCQLFVNYYILQPIDTIETTIPSYKTVNKTKYNDYVVYIFSHFQVLLNFYDFSTCKDRFMLYHVFGSGIFSKDTEKFKGLRAEVTRVFWRTLPWIKEHFLFVPWQ
ncbi:hypothetical protein BDF21DRAFT_448401 [Thamnidium elegans]|nr:hypothetical protein BDF21DRAFT_448401 [Thamnidium elegans]